MHVVDNRQEFVKPIEVHTVVYTEHIPGSNFFTSTQIYVLVH